MSPIEYYISTHASRKGKADTALKTAESGYLTRKLCDASQEVVVREQDCGSDKYIVVSRARESQLGSAMSESIYGRNLAEDIFDHSETRILEKGQMLDKEAITMIDDLEIEFVKVRSPLTCQTPSGVCQKCYGMDLATRRDVDV